MVFPHLASSGVLLKINSLVKEAVKDIEVLQDAYLIELASLDNLYKKLLVERHLISYEHAKSKYGLVILNKQEDISIMVNEEDHIRAQAYAAGLAPQKALETISKIDDALAEKLNFAYSRDWGYLTVCPTNIGTGLRASVLIHLPGLSISRQINKLLKDVSKLGMTMRGLYGEGTEARGDLFQLSNQVTLGQTEAELTDNIEKIALQIINYEKETRESLIKKNRYKLEDRIYRAYAILKYTRTISSKEALELLSLLRLGINLGILDKSIIKDSDLVYSKLNYMLVLIQPAHVQFTGINNLQIAQEETLSAFERRDCKRAKLIREMFRED
jgi:protein arginine kinase